jgi:RsiW-degrading membrane proteinase PrsW (M82 family)
VPATDAALAPAPAARPPRPTVRRPPPTPEGWRRYARWSLIVALVPLAVYTLRPDDPVGRYKKTRDKYPEIAKRFPRPDQTEQFVQALPGQRLEGALLPRKALGHWFAAALAAVLFWEFILIVQPMGNSTSRQLWAVGIFTGTVGVLTLLLFQVVAALTLLPGLRGGCIGTVVLGVFKLISYSYRAAVDPSSGFFLSAVGFTFGVGLCEELVKAWPVLWHFRRSGTLDVRGAVVWGLASGIGFGVSEGITYASDFYNGVSSGGVYLVRFISCVGLHAVWSASVAILIWKARQEVREARGVAWLALLAKVLPAAMVLHGLYDTLLKKGYEFTALTTAAASFALFFWLYDRHTRRESSGALALARA